MAYLAEALLYVNTLKNRIRGVRIVEEPPVLRHFTVKLAPIHGALVV